MVAHGRNRNMPVTATIENLTVPGDDLHWGDTFRVTPSGLPNGRNRIQCRTYDTFTPYADLRDTKGNEPAVFVIGDSSSANPANNGTYSPGNTINVLLDDNRTLLDGLSLQLSLGEVLAPR